MVTTLNSTRFVLICATLISIVGNAFYACAGYLDKSISLFIIILSRFILGFGSGTLGVTRSFVEKASSKDEKGQSINLSVLSQYAGFTLSPLFSEAVMHFTTFEVNLNASLHGIIMICLHLLLLLLLFQLPAVDKFNKKDVLANEEEKFGMITHHIHKDKGTVCKDFTNSEYYCFILIILVNFVFRGTLGVMETSMSASMFKLSGNSTPETGLACLE
ncbi:hypothetical protein HDV04_000250 [Boothiomyces sp. JEL0838]|nr:hypothetical protein HDV04_000250 [Boothiomyces sp. JEL0838]